MGLLVVLGVAHGMQCFHKLAFKIILHLDLKPSNILMDNGYRAKVSDFGLAKLALEDKASVETRLASTFGYLLVEYVGCFSEVFSKDEDRTTRNAAIKDILAMAFGFRLLVAADERFMVLFLVLVLLKLVKINISPCQSDRRLFTHT